MASVIVEPLRISIHTQPHTLAFTNVVCCYCSDVDWFYHIISCKQCIALTNWSTHENICKTIHLVSCHALVCLALD